MISIKRYLIDILQNNRLFTLLHRYHYFHFILLFFCFKFTIYVTLIIIGVYFLRFNRFLYLIVSYDIIFSYLIPFLDDLFKFLSYIEHLL